MNASETDVERRLLPIEDVLDLLKYNGIVESYGYGIIVINGVITYANRSCITWKTFDTIYDAYIDICREICI